MNRTPLHHWHAAHGARFQDVDGWQVPAVYSTVEEEMQAARSSLALADISAEAEFTIPQIAQGLIGPAGFWLLGPATDALVRQLTHFDLGQLTPGSRADTGLAGVHALLVRPAELSMPSLRLYVSWDLGEYVWEKLMAAGRPWGIKPLGMEALAGLK